MSAADAVIEVEGLTKSYGSVQALKGLDMRVDRGQVHGFMGPTARESPRPSGCCWGC
jgi:ABC-2 type transport system ATP-binding protein